jgi:hypothetical protein
MGPLDISRAMTFATAEDFDQWLNRHGSEENELIVCIYKKGSDKQTVTREQFQETARFQGWIDGGQHR